MTLKDREWTCPQCDVKLDRDKNASKNILAQVQRELNFKSDGNRHLKPAELSSIDEAMKQQRKDPDFNYNYSYVVELIDRIF